MMAALKNTIGIFGGTFDPVHNGHISIAKSFLASGYIEELWILLSPDPPHKQENGVASFQQRFQMLQAAFRSTPDTVVSDLESRLSKPSYTVQTIEHLQKKYPGYSFLLCIGTDSLLTFTDWHKWDELLEPCELLVADRPSENSRKANKKVISRARFVDHVPVVVSSSEVRKRIANNQPVDDLLPKRVLDIIRQQNLYRKK